ncbi:hypothetical protein OSB04_un000032 [Centaurea solstitialis]|uniref:Reverse transcriptase domain-containing protein n=1 Tax=Centaurea solstitialis TaxID=347529 RepID=A0AA38SDG2_9ASTR|nr:hypothetical protein OSB04_un000032 [Centaurea solstitialis]
MYSFKKDGVNVTLAPLDTRKMGTEALILNKSAFMDFTRPTKPGLMFAMVIAEAIPSSADIPHEIRPLVTEFQDVFPIEIPAGLPLMRAIQHCIDYVSGAVIPNKPAYRMNPKEYDRLSPDSHAPGDEWKTAFKTRDGLFEWMVMPFGLSNAPSTFMRLMNHIFKPLIGQCVVIYFDDILIFSLDLQQHLHHLRRVFSIMREQKLYANSEKCRFLSPEVLFLGYLISGNGIRMDEAKIEAITTWPTPSTIHEARSFPG